MKLKIGQKYKVDDLDLRGWKHEGHLMGPKEEAKKTQGYSYFAYFDPEGKYLGPDEYGIEPAMEEEHPELTPDQLAHARRRINMKDIKDIPEKPRRFMTRMAADEADQYYQRYLDSQCSWVGIAGQAYPTSLALRKVDPVAYRNGLREWADREGITIV